MIIPAHYRKPFLIAVLFHVVLLAFLIFSFVSHFRAPPASASQQIIHATAIIQPTATPEPVEKPVEAQAEKKELEKVALEKQQQAEAAAKQVEKQKRIAVQAEKAAKLKIQMAAKQKEIQKKKIEALAKKELEEEAQKKIKMAQTIAKKQRQQKLLAEQKKLQQQLMQQQLNSEAKSIEQVQTSLAQDGAIDQYKARILSLIQSNWRIDRVDSQLKCVYSVSVAPDGTVLGETLVRSSGDSNLDQSAKQAILASSPLPVPSDPTLFNHFRQLVLTLSPQGYVQRS